MVDSKFALIGARAVIKEAPKGVDFTVNVRKDKEGEYFDIKVADEVELLIQDAQKKDRHLLLLAKVSNPDRPHDKPTVHRFLCGHDERHWFSATVPKPVTTVVQAKQALKPPEVVNFELSHGMRNKQLHKRHKKLKTGTKLHRQGEFFFIPDPSFKVGPVVIKNEPMRGGGSHFHYAQYLCRTGGKQVFVKGMIIINAKELAELDVSERNKYRSMMADSVVFVKGKITHVEHATVDLGDIWHRVFVNTEPRGSANRRGQMVGNVFLD